MFPLMFDERRKFPQAVNDSGQVFQDGVHVFIGVVAAETEADGAVRGGIGDAQRADDVRRLERTRGAGRAG